MPVEQDAASRSRNVQALLAAVDRAANAGPVDLLVLPGACDCGGANPPRGLTLASATMVKEMLAIKAREWGVFLAAGFHAFCDGKWIPQALLFDPDGDTAATSDARSHAVGARSGATMTETRVGRLAVVEPGAGPHVLTPLREGAPPRVVAVPIATHRKGAAEHAQLATLAAIRGLVDDFPETVWALVDQRGDPQEKRNHGLAGSMTLWIGLRVDSEQQRAADGGVFYTIRSRADHSPDPAAGSERTRMFGPINEARRAGRGHSDGCKP